MDDSRRREIEENLARLRAMKPVIGSFDTDDQYEEALAGFRHRIGLSIQHGERLLKDYAVSHSGSVHPGWKSGDDHEEDEEIISEEDDLLRSRGVDPTMIENLKAAQTSLAALGTQMTL